MASQWAFVETTDYQEWSNTLDPRTRRFINRKLQLLGMYGPLLGRPHVDHIKGSRYPNLKELRITGAPALRILFCFDAHRQAVLLTGGRKSSNKDWYSRAIQRAEEIMDKYNA